MRVSPEVPFPQIPLIDNRDAVKERKSQKQKEVKARFNVLYNRMRNVTGVVGCKREVVEAAIDDKGEKADKMKSLKEEREMAKSYHDWAQSMWQRTEANWALYPPLPVAAYVQPPAVYVAQPPPAPPVVLDEIAVDPLPAQVLLSRAMMEAAIFDLADEDVAPEQFDQYLVQEQNVVDPLPAEDLLSRAVMEAAIFDLGDEAVAPEQFDQYLVQEQNVAPPDLHAYDAPYYYEYPVEEQGIFH